MYLASYTRAARILDILEMRGYVAAGEGAKPREVYGTENSPNSDLSKDAQDFDEAQKGEYE